MPGKLTMVTETTEKDGPTKMKVPHRNQLLKHTLPNKEMPQLKDQTQSVEQLEAAKPCQDHKPVQEVALQTQDTKVETLVTTSSDQAVLSHNSNNNNKTITQSPK